MTDCKCDVDPSRIKIDYVKFVIDAPWEELCDYCAISLDEVFAQVGQIEVESVGSAIQGGLSVSDAYLYVSQERPIEDLGTTNGDRKIKEMENFYPFDDEDLMKEMKESK